MESEFISGIGQGFGEAIYKDIKRSAGGILPKGKDGAIAKAISESAAHLDQVKTIYQTDKPLSLSDLYIPERFEHDEQEFSDQDVIQNLRDNQRIVIRARGGAGKSWFMKTAFLTIAQESQNRIPIFFELRKLEGEQSLLDALAKALSPKGEIDAEDIKTLCEKARPILFLDGFDEIKEAQRDHVTEQILTLERAYPNIGLVVSSRPYESLAAWATFYIYDTQLFNYAQFQEMVARAPLDDEMKQKFLEKADQAYFEEYKELVAVPLIGAMLFNIFNHNLELPLSRIDFYREYINVLYHAHDRTKGVFRREHWLSQDDATRIAAYIAIKGIIAETYEFEEEWLRDEIGHAKERFDISKDQKDILCELEDHMNLLVKDGLYVRFVHRSFQEYFAAHYVMRHLESEKKAKFLRRFYESNSDSCYEFADEIDPDDVYQHFAQQEIQSLKDGRYFPVNLESSSMGDVFETMGERYLGFGKFKPDNLDRKVFIPFLFNSQNARFAKQFRSRKLPIKLPVESLLIEGVIYKILSENIELFDPLGHDDLMCLISDRQSPNGLDIQVLKKSVLSVKEIDIYDDLLKIEFDDDDYDFETAEKIKPAVYESVAQAIPKIESNNQAIWQELDAYVARMEARRAKDDEFELD